MNYFFERKRSKILTKEGKLMDRCWEQTQVDWALWCIRLHYQVNCPDFLYFFWRNNVKYLYVLSFYPREFEIIWR